MPVMLTLGHGYCAAHLAPRLLARGWRVIGATRSPDKARALAASGVEPLLWPGDDPAPALEALSQATHLLISAAPNPEEGDPVLARLRAPIAARAGDFSWVGYLSTTGVYGDRGGAWIDEGAERRPSTARGALRVAAEDAWSALWRERGLPLHIFRLAGIYGPGRGPFAKVRAGKARRIVKPGQVFSRIHVEDVARTLEASMARPSPGAAYNVCDDLPAPPEDVIAEAARLLGAPLPPAEDFETAEMTPMARSFYAESKRTSNRRIREELGVELAYPDYRAGLAALLAEERAAGG
ncbi:SDR family oxidoreductase [Oceanicella actignis]|uniref:SDR family oxidoreductase n=1 Tax=Oceanicella actignis TaxID=1189325 RepID=UPI0011E7E45A|nr:SDR family oxidoreductase [Oceanicella actignis]TYO89094.1 nucleoside-diphosphate-sugar epimerase [Oceanicella actignis]